MRTGGYLLVLGDARPLEFDTLKCAHCQSVIVVKAGSMGQVYLIADDTQPSGWRDEAGAYCASCAGPICLRCEAARSCIPWERQLEHLEALAKQWRE